MRTAVYWLCRIFMSTLDSDEQREDAVDWLAGNDGALLERRNQRSRDAIVMAGGELG